VATLRTTLRRFVTAQVAKANTLEEPTREGYVLAVEELAAFAKTFYRI
jgi:hypothetical protein